MEDRQRPATYRGYRPPPLWWFKLKYLGGMLVFGLFMAFASAQVFAALQTGRVSNISNQPAAVSLWSESPWWFAWYLLLWIGMDLLFLGGFLLFFSRLKGLDGPSAETRL